jgi:integrase/recombinase XerD
MPVTLIYVYYNDKYAHIRSKKLAQATVLADKDIKRVLAGIAVGRHAERNRLAFCLSVYAGCRVGEISAIKIGDAVNIDGKARAEIKLAATQTKGNKGRVVYVSDKLQREIEAYIGSLKSFDMDMALIGTQRRRAHFSNVTMCALFKRFYDDAGLKNSGHAGRRTMATRLHGRGCGIKTLQILLGHKNIATTARYVDVTDDALHGAVNMM